MKHVIITGTSRGLGKALAEAFLHSGWRVVGISRTHTLEHLLYTAVEADLSQPSVAETVDLMMDEQADEYLLINNAGMLGEIGHAGAIPSSTYQQGYQLNLIAPALLINRFMQLTANKKRTILTISSGAAQTPYDGWGMYCSSKAALEMLHEVLMKELELSNDPLTRVYTFSPGVMDTIMQHQIRGASKSAFSNIDRFTDLQKMHQLPSAETVASKILQLLFSNENLRNGRYNIRDFEQ